MVRCIRPASAAANSTKLAQNKNSTASRFNHKAMVPPSNYFILRNAVVMIERIALVALLWVAFR